MTLLAPFALVGLAVPVAIYLVHWLFGTRRRQVIPALFLWTNLPRSATGRRQRHVPPFSVLLALQLLIAALGILGLARLAVPGQAPRHVALILDASATMQATDIAPSRFDAARQALLQRLNTLSPGDLVSIIRAGQDAELLSSGTAQSVRSAVSSAAPGVTAPAIREALALASTRIAQTPDRVGQIIVFTDGAWPAPDSVGPLAAPVEVVPTGGGSNNRAITAATVRMDPSGHGQTAFIEIANESDTPARVPMMVTADGSPLDARQVVIDARSRAQLSIPLPDDVRHVTVQLTGHDALALDDRVDVLAPGGPPRQVDLLGTVSNGLQRAIESVPSLQVRTTDSATPADLTVLVGVLPAQLPPGPLLLIDPPADSARLLGVGLGSGDRVELDDPLLDGVDVAALLDLTPSVASVPGWAHVAFGTPLGPLLMHGLLDGHPVVSMTFDPTVSGLEKSLAFPLLINNATSYLLAQADSLTNPATPRPIDAAEADIRPRPLASFDTVSPPPSVGPARSPLSDVWPWLAAGALVLLGVEWLVFARRG